MPSVVFPTPFGACGLCWAGASITRFNLPEATEALTRRRVAPAGGDIPLDAAPEWIRAVAARVRRHFEGDLQDFSDIALDWTVVSEFQRSVYAQTRLILPGFKRGYGEVAGALALGAGSARAVGVALAMNPWPLLVPCHRVVSADDRMTGFSGPGGIRTKTRLLALEGAELISE